MVINPIMSGVVFTKDLNTDVVNPTTDENKFKKIDDLNSYDGLIWGLSLIHIS